LREQIRNLFTDEILLNFWTHEKCPPSQQEFKQCQLDSNIKHERCMPCWEAWLDKLTNQIISLLAKRCLLKTELAGNYARTEKEAYAKNILLTWRPVLEIEVEK